MSEINSGLSFEIEQTQQPALSFSLGSGSGSALGLDVTQINDILLSLVERCIARDFKEENDYKKFNYVIFQHRLWQFIQDHAPGEWDPSQVRQITLAEEVQLLFDALMVEEILVAGGDWTLANGIYQKRIRGAYIPGKTYHVSSVSENPNAYLVITYHLTAPIYAPGGGSQTFSVTIAPTGGIKDAVFTTYAGPYQSYIDEFTVYAYGLTAEDAAQTSIYTRSMKSDLIAGDFSANRAYSIGDYVTRNGKFVRFKWQDHSAGDFDPYYADDTTVGSELASIVNNYIGCFLQALGVQIYIPHLNFYACYDTWYWQPGHTTLVKWPTPSGGGTSQLMPETPHYGFVNGQQVLLYTEPYTLPTTAGSDRELFVLKDFLTGGFGGKLDTTLKGAANGLAELDANGKIPSSQLPSYVDDVLEYAGTSNFPQTGETGKIYVDTTTDKTYRWSGSQYVVISETLALGETSATAYRGDRGKAAYDHAQLAGSAFASGLYKITTNSEGHVTGATAAGNADITDLMIDDAGSANADTYTWSRGKIAGTIVDEQFVISTGEITSFPKEITDARITAECIVMDEIPGDNIDIGWVTTAGKLILYGSLPSGTTLPGMKLKLERIHGLTADAPSISLRMQTSNSSNGNYLVAEAKNLIPGTQYMYRLYKTVNNEATQVNGIRATTSYPTYSRWWQEATYNLEDGVEYFATISSVSPNMVLATSGGVTFTAALSGGGNS